MLFPVNDHKTSKIIIPVLLLTNTVVWFLFLVRFVFALIDMSNKSMTVRKNILIDRNFSGAKKKYAHVCCRKCLHTCMQG